MTKESSFTPTNCEGVPFDPFFSIDFNPTTVGQLTAPITGAGTPADQHPLSQSHIKTTRIVFPYSSVRTRLHRRGKPPGLR